MKIALEEIIKLHSFPRYKIDQGDEIPLIVDVGGYKGDYAEKVFAEIPSQIIIFEPVKEYAEAIEKRLKGKATVIQKGLGKPGVKKIYRKNNSSSLYHELVESPLGEEEIEIVALSYYNWPINLLKLNCEGAEYDILEDLIEAGQLKDIQEILVQFHKISGYGKRRKKIIEKLRETHELVYNFKWMLWRKKSR